MVLDELGDFHIKDFMNNFVAILIDYNYEYLNLKQNEK